MSRSSTKVLSHRDLIVWQRAIELVRETYRLSARLPREEVYGLTTQMRRAAVSVPANIAEGKARRATRDYIRFLSIANGSLRELETYWEVIVDLGFVGQEELAKSTRLGEEVGKMLTKLRESLGRKVGGQV